MAQDPAGRDKSSGRLGRLKNFTSANKAPAAAEAPPPGIDPLTGLPTRDQLNEFVSRAVQRSVPMSSRAAVLFVGVGQVRDVNDSYGPEVGDLLVRAVGQRLVSIDVPHTK